MGDKAFGVPDEPKAAADVRPASSGEAA